MGIRLSIDVESPLSPEDHELLAGIAVMTLAIANRELSPQTFPDVAGGDAAQSAADETEDENEADEDGR